MHYISDRSRHFAKRPYYSRNELDQECETIITDFARQTSGRLELPIPTDTLTKLIERDAADLDLFSDLSAEGREVDGLTDFFPGAKPRVKILRDLSYQSNENRLRTTLTHEYGHVHFHDCLWQLEMKQPRLDEQELQKACPRCKRERLIEAPLTDWMEWQAGYISGSLLMPCSHIKSLAAEFFERQKLLRPLALNSAHVSALIDLVKGSFRVSAEAARVRLLQLDFLSKQDLGPRLL